MGSCAGAEAPSCVGSLFPGAEAPGFRPAEASGSALLKPRGCTLLMPSGKAKPLPEERLSSAKAVGYLWRVGVRAAGFLGAALVTTEASLMMMSSGVWV